MASNFYYSMCKTLCISACKTPAKVRAKNVYNHPTTPPSSAKLHFPTVFSPLSHNFSHRHSTSDNHPTFPLFHKPYYYNYKLFI